MDWLKELIKNNPFAALLAPTGLGSLNFLASLLAALSDGNIDGNELHQLMSSASGLQTILLIIILIALRNKKDK